MIYLVIVIGIAIHALMQYWFWWWLPQMFLIMILFILPWWRKLCQSKEQYSCLRCSYYSQCPFLDASDDTM